MNRTELDVEDKLDLIIMQLINLITIGTLNDRQSSKELKIFTDDCFLFESVSRLQLVNRI